MQRTVYKWEAWGVLVIFLLGALLHFVFELSGRLPWVGAFAAVNESVWEHLKLAFWPTLLWALLEYPRLRHANAGFWWAKALALYVMPLFIALSFYLYTALTGHSILAVDITLFFLAILLGQYVSYRVLNTARQPAWLSWLGLALIILLGTAYAVFTYLPPHVGLFREELTGNYGISGS